MFKRKISAINESYWEVVHFSLLDVEKIKRIQITDFNNPVDYCISSHHLYSCDSLIYAALAVLTFISSSEVFFFLVAWITKHVLNKVLI